MAKLLTRVQIAKAEGVTPSAVTRWQADGCPVAHRAPRGRPSLFDPDAVRAWRQAVDVAKRAEGLSLEAERAALAKVQRERITLDIKRRRGQLFDASVALQAWSGMATAFRAQALALPRALAEVLTHLAPQGPAAIEAKLMEAVRDCLKTLSEWKPPAGVGEASKAGEETP